MCKNKIRKSACNWSSNVERVSGQIKKLKKTSAVLMKEQSYTSSQLVIVKELLIFKNSSNNIRAKS